MEKWVGPHSVLRREWGKLSTHDCHSWLLGWHKIPKPVPGQNEKEMPFLIAAILSKHKHHPFLQRIRSCSSYLNALSDPPLPPITCTFSVLTCHKANPVHTLFSCYLWDSCCVREARVWFSEFSRDRKWSGSSNCDADDDDNKEYRNPARRKMAQHWYIPDS